MKKHPKEQVIYRIPQYQKKKKNYRIPPNFVVAAQFAVAARLSPTFIAKLVKHLHPES